MNKTIQIEKEVRTIFCEHHKVEQKDEDIYQKKKGRLTKNMCNYLQLPKDWFKGKKVLDACCGTCLSETHRYLEEGSNVTCFDLPYAGKFDDSRIKKKFKGKYNFVRGSVLKLPFPDNTFDFINCEGALHHTVDGHKGLKELARVCKKGGYMFTCNFGSSGIFRDVEDFLRNKYKQDKNFKKIIDNLDAKQLNKYMTWLNNNLEKGIPKIPLSYFDEDFILMIKDRIQPPIYDRYDEKEWMQYHRKLGLSPKRITRYPNFYNIRKYMCPIYLNYKHPLSKLINGDGFMQIIAKKK